MNKYIGIWGIDFFFFYFIFVKVLKIWGRYLFFFYEKNLVGILFYRKWDYFDFFFDWDIKSEKVCNLFYFVNIR